MRRSVDPVRRNCDLLLMEEGHFENGKWKAGRRLNGDESANISLDAPGMLRMKWFTYE